MKRQYSSDGVDPKEIVITACHQCKKGFKTKNRSQKYCSNICRDYFNNHKGVKSRYKKDDPHQKNLEILNRICKDKDQVRIEFKRLMELGFDLGLPCRVIQTEDGRIWRVHEGYCYCQIEEQQFLFFLGRESYLPIKEKRKRYL